MVSKFALGFAFAALTSAALAQETQLKVVEGKGPVFAAPGTQFAWGVLKGADEARTTVVVRVSAPGFRTVSASGGDPAGKEKVWMSRSQMPRVMDLRIARTGLTKYPRTAIRFYREERGAVGAKPELEVFFAGVPEGTREFSNAAELEHYLTGQVGR